MVTANTMQAKAVKRFKGLLKRRRPELMDGILGHSSRFVAPPAALGTGYSFHHSRSQDTFNRRPIEGVLAAEGVHHEMHVNESDVVTPHSAEPTPALSRAPTESLGSPHTSTSRHQSQSPSLHQTGSRNFSPDDSGRGHAHDPLLDTLFLSVGAGPSASEEPEPGTVCESPGAVEENIYERAYEEEMERIISQRGKSATMYLSRRVDHKHELRQKEGVVDFRRTTTGSGGGFASLVRRAAETAKDSQTDDGEKMETSNETEEK